MLLPTAIPFFGVKSLRLTVSTSSTEIQETPHGTENFIPRAALKQILAIAWPLIVANSFWNLQLTIDRIYLGAWSTEALGAAMAVMGVFWTPMALLNKQPVMLRRSSRNTSARASMKKSDQPSGRPYIVSAAVSFFLGFLFVSSDIFTMIGHSPAMRDAGTTVLRRNLLVGIADRTCRRL